MANYNNNNNSAGNMWDGNTANNQNVPSTYRPGAGVHPSFVNTSPNMVMNPQGHPNAGPLRTQAFPPQQNLMMGMNNMLPPNSPLNWATNNPLPASPTAFLPNTTRDFANPGNQNMYGIMPYDSQMGRPALNDGRSQHTRHPTQVHHAQPMALPPPNTRGPESAQPRAGPPQTAGQNTPAASRVQMPRTPSNHFFPYSSEYHQLPPQEVVPLSQPQPRFGTPNMSQVQYQSGQLQPAQYQLNGPQTTAFQQPQQIFQRGQIQNNQLQSPQIPQHAPQATIYQEARLPVSQKGSEAAATGRLRAAQPGPQRTRRPPEVARQTTTVAVPRDPDSRTEASRGSAVDENRALSQVAGEPEDERPTSSGPATTAVIQTIVKEAVHEVYRLGVLAGLMKGVEKLTEGLITDKTISGVHLVIPKNMTVMQAKKEMFECQRERFNAFLAKKPDDKVEVGEVRQRLEQVLSRAARQTAATRNTRNRSVISVASAHDAEAVSQGNMTPTQRRTATASDTPQSQENSQGGRRAKRKAADYTVVGKQAEYAYGGQSSVSYKCSDGQTRILSPTTVTKLQTRDSAPMDAGSNASPVMPSPQVTTPLKRKFGPGSDRSSVSKKTKHSHQLDQDTTICPNDTPTAVQPLALPMPNSETRPVSTVTNPDAKLTEYMGNLDRASSVKVAEVQPVEVPDKVGSYTSQLAEGTQAAPGEINYDEYVNYEAHESQFGDATLGEMILESGPTGGSKTTEMGPPQGPVADPREDRIKELTKRYLGLPHCVVKDFMEPHLDSNFSEPRAAAERGEFGDMSYLLDDKDVRLTAMDEYDTADLERQGISPDQRPEWDPVVRNAEKRQNKLQRKIDEQKAAGRRQKEREVDERREADRQTHGEWNQAMQDEPSEAVTIQEQAHAAAPSGSSAESYLDMFGEWEDMFDPQGQGVDYLFSSGGDDVP